MAFVLDFEELVQAQGHLAGLMIIIQQALMQVGLQVLHIKCFYVVPGQFAHVVDQDPLARLVSVGFTPDNAVRVFEQALYQVLLRDVRRQLRAGDAGPCRPGQEPGLGVCQQCDPQLLECLACLAVARDCARKISVAVQRRGGIGDDVLQGFLVFGGDVVVTVSARRDIHRQGRAVGGQGLPALVAVRQAMLDFPVA